MKRIIFIALASLLLFSGCSSNGNKGKGTPKIHKNTGSAPYELLVVANKEWVKSIYGEELMDVLSTEVPGLPQVEPNFGIVNINPEGFSSTFKVYANILKVDIGRQYPKAGIQVAKDLYAHPQTVATLYAPDNISLVEYVKSHSDELINLFVEEELNREKSFLEKINSGKVYTAVKNMFGYTICVPQEINAVKKGDKFIWASSDTETSNNKNFCIYTVPYNSVDDFKKEHLIFLRDSVLCQYVLGDKEGQYVATDARSVTERELTIDGHYVKEIRGLWEMEGDMMGGPFVEYAQVDTVKNLIVITEGFVYAPEKRKRDLIRELESSLRTLKMNPKPQKQ